MPVPAHNFLGSLSPLPELNLELKNFYAQDDAGNVLSEAICYLYERGSETLVETLRGANGLALANPFVSDEQGLVQFAAPNGLYDLRVVKGGRDSRLRMQCNDVTETEALAENAARALEEKLANSNDPSYGTGLLPATRWPLWMAVKYGLQSMLSSRVRSIWELVHLVTKGPVANDPSTWDWWPALQAAIDTGGAWYLPDDNGTGATYLISRALQVRFNRALSLFGPAANRPRATIKTTPNFTDRSMLRQWDETWYAVGETDRNERPANLAPYANSIDRYLNLRNLGFYVDSDAGGEVTCIDLVALQETSYFEGLVFNGNPAVEKGWPMRMRTGGGFEVSMNGMGIRNVTVYGSKWRGELMCVGSGSDLDVDTWVTSNAVHKESPFQTAMIDTTFRNIHSEAFCTGQPTFKSTANGMSVSASFIVIRDLQGAVFDCVGPLSLSQITLYPSAGSTANITNLASIDLLVEVLASATRTRKLVPTGMSMITRVQTYLRDNLICHDSSGHQLTFSPSTAKLQMLTTNNSSSLPIVLPYRLAGSADQHHFAEVVLMGRRLSTGLPALLRVRLMQANNFAGFAPRSASVIENDNWPGTITLTLNGNYYSVVTTDALGVSNITAVVHGALLTDAVNS